MHPQRLSRYAAICIAAATVAARGGSQPPIGRRVT